MANKLMKVAYEFQRILNAQSSSVQPGEIADDFPEYFPNKNQTTSPLMGKLDVFLSKLLPEDVNASIGFLVAPGFKPQFNISFTKGGMALDNKSWANAIVNFLLAEMAKFTAAATAKYKGRMLDAAVTVATHTI